MISRETFLNALDFYRELDGERLIEDSKLKLRQGSYEYIFTADSVNYIGDGAEFLAVSMASEWTQHGTPDLTDGTLTLDGSSWLNLGGLSLGGQDFQISGRAFESAENMTARRKIFELYTSANLNISLYSSGAGKNLDLLVNCGGVFDNYSEPAILEREYHFALKWNQAAGTLTLKIDGQPIYSVEVAGLSEAQTFDEIILGASTLHAGATWLGTIRDFKIYNGFTEG